jgi:hypothetical protein
MASVLGFSAVAVSPTRQWCQVIVRKISLQGLWGSLSNCPYIPRLVLNSERQGPLLKE